MSKDRILVTGGAGFIGSHITEQYAEDHEILVIDDLRSGYEENLPSDIHMIQCRIELAEKEIQKFRPTIVSHMAAQLEISAGYADPVAESDENTLNTLRLLDTCRRIGSVQHFIFASSACVYGSRREPGAPMYEAARPQWSYGVSKLAAEHYVNLYSKHFKVSNLRFGIVFGPREWYGRVLTNFAERGIQGKDIIVFGDGSARRDFTYVRDLASAHRHLTTYQTKQQITIDVGSGLQTSVLSLARLIASKCNVGVRTENVKPGEVSKHMPGRLRLPDEMQSMHLTPPSFACTRTITHGQILDEYLDYARSKPVAWNGVYRV